MADGQIAPSRMSPIRFDWQMVEALATQQIIQAVTDVHQQHPHEQISGALFFGFYGDGSAAYWPSVAVGTEQSLDTLVERYRVAENTTTHKINKLTASLRWSGPDLIYSAEPSTAEAACADAFTAVASQTQDFDEWEQLYNLFLACFPRAAKCASESLIQAALVSPDFIAIAADEAEELIALSLSPAQLQRHFPKHGS